MPEICLQEALPCEVSPLGFHLLAALKEKIWKGEFVEVLSLLPSAKDVNFRSGGKSDNRLDEDRRMPITRSFFNWL